MPANRKARLRLPFSGVRLMSEPSLRLGDLIDDHCPRCRLLLNHAVGSMVDGQVMKVICQTCYTEHAYHHGEGGKKKPTGRQTLFEQVLARTGPDQPAEPTSAPAAKKRASEPARYASRRGAKSKER
jgi:hypothetical protein